MSRKQVRVSPAVVQAARLRVAVNDRQNKPTSAVTRRIAEARVAAAAEVADSPVAVMAASIASSPVGSVPLAGFRGALRGSSWVQVPVVGLYQRAP